MKKQTMQVSRGRESGQRDNNYRALRQTHASQVEGTGRSPMWLGLWEGTRRGVEKGVARPDSVVLIGRGEKLALILNKMTAIGGFGFEES